MSKEFNELLSGVLGREVSAPAEIVEEKEDNIVEEKAESQISTETAVEEKMAEISESKSEEVSKASTETETAEPAYVPNFKYKVKDKEYELEEKAKAYIKSKEDEDFFRDIYTKAAGLEEIKTQRDKLREENAAYTKKTQDLEIRGKTLDYLDSVLSSGNYDEFMNVLSRAGLSGKELVKFAQSVASVLEKSPEQTERERLEYDRQRILAERSQTEESLNGKVDSISQELFNTKLQMAMSDATVQPIIKQYNEVFGLGSVGKGAFWDEVAKEGIAYYDTYGKDPDPSEMVVSVANKFNKFFSAHKPKEEHIPTKTKIITNPNSKALPNIGSGSNISVVGKKNMTISDLERAAEEYNLGKTRR